MRAAALAYRAFVHANPNGYGLLFTNVAPELQPDPEAVAETGRPLVEAMASLVGPDASLPAARTVAAWAHGFVSMELAGAFRLGGDLDDAYEAGIETILAGSAQGRPERQGHDEEDQEQAHDQDEGPDISRSSCLHVASPRHADRPRGDPPPAYDACSVVVGAHQPHDRRAPDQRGQAAP